MAQNRKEPRWQLSTRLPRWFQAAASTCYMMVLFAQPAAASDTIWSRFSTIMADVYGELVGISTIVAVTAAAVALLVRMISRNDCILIWTPYTQNRPATPGTPNMPVWRNGLPW